MFHGTKATMFLGRSMYQVIPEKGAAVDPAEERGKRAGNMEHWADFLECVKTRQKPNAGVETNHHAATACHLGNIAYRSKLRVDFDPAAAKIAQAEARKPWRIAV